MAEWMLELNTWSLAPASMWLALYQSTHPATELDDDRDNDDCECSKNTTKKKKYWKYILPFKNFGGTSWEMPNYIKINDDWNCYRKIIANLQSM